LLAEQNNESLGTGPMTEWSNVFYCYFRYWMAGKTPLGLLISNRQKKISSAVGYAYT